MRPKHADGYTRFAPTLTAALCAVALFVGSVKAQTLTGDSSSQASGNAAVPQYGADASAGHYVQSPDAKLYYERYGSGGRPLVLLHGGEYGYIDEFGGLIGEMSKRRTVIAIATRGYGRSERGAVALSHRQFAQDAALVIKNIFQNGEKVDLLGFSEGAITSYILAAAHPELFHRLIAISGSLGLYCQTMQSVEAEPLTPELMLKQVPDLVASRKKVMAKPELWEPLIRELDLM